MRVEVAFLVAMAACGDNELADYTRGGTRLAVEWYVADDGTRVPTGTVQDRQLGEPCYGNEWTDGTHRCTVSDGYVGYSDDACTQPVISPYSDTAQIAELYDNAACSIAKAYRVGTPMGQGMIHFKTATGCTNGYQTDLSSVGAEVPADTFVQLAREQVGDGRLRAIHYKSSDGMVWPLQTYDTELAASCMPGERECQPYGSFDAKYLDAACTQRVAITYGDGSCGELEKYFLESDRCGTTNRTYRLGAGMQPAKIYALDTSSGACTEDMVDASAHYHAIGTEVVAAEMARGYGDAPGRRLQDIYFGGSGVAALAGVFDTELGIPCTWNVATDGMTRCLPNYFSWADWYADGTCTTTVSLISMIWTDGCAEPAPPAYTTGGTAVRVVGPRYTKPVFTFEAGACTKVTATNQAFYTLGDLVAPESFVAATKMFD